MQHTEKFRITNKIRLQLQREDIKRLHYFKGTLSQLRLERTPESRYSCQK